MGARPSRFSVAWRPRRQAGLPPNEDWRRIRCHFDLDNDHLHLADQWQDRGLPIEPAARQPEMCRVGGILIQGGINRQPQPSVAAFIDVHLGPRVVIERAVHIDKPDVDARRNAQRSCQRDEQHGVLVAITHLRAQHFERRRQTDGRLLVEQRVDFSGETLDLGPHIGRATHHALRCSADLRRIALDKRLRLKIALKIGGRCRGAQLPGIENLDNVPVHGLSGALHIVA